MPFPQNLRDLVNDAISRGLTGEQVDMLVEGFTINFLDPEKPQPGLVVSVSGAPAFELFIKDKIVPVIAARGILLFVAIYPPRGGFPLARIYKLQVPDLAEFARIGRSFDARGFRVVPMTDAEFNSAIKAEGHEQRIRSYCETYNKQSDYFAGLATGRRQSTSVKSGFNFYSRGCIRCGREAGLLSTTFWDPTGETDGHMMGFYVCPEHLKEANSHPSYYHFLLSVWGVQPPLIVGELSLEFLIEEAVNVLREVGCEIIKIAGSTITAQRTSGFRIIARISQTGDHAYVFFDANGREVARIDTADHHDVPYGPAHLHKAPKKNNKDIESSFTLGSPGADAPLIRRIVEEHDK